MSDAPHADMHYFHMGPFPVYVGFTTSEEAFNAEMERLKIKNVKFLAHANANATAHYFTNKGTLCAIIAMPPWSRKVTREAYAGLVAHEAMHVVQEMQSELARDNRLGIEAEAYLIQQIVQESLQIAWDSKYSRRTEPVS